LLMVLGPEMAIGVVVATETEEEGAEDKAGDTEVVVVVEDADEATTGTEPNDSTGGVLLAPLVPAVRRVVQ
jgi:hypothetical protein